MRKIIVLSFISMDGVMQAPGGPTEDTSDNFEFGGWTVPYFDEYLGTIMADQMEGPFDLLLGRKTYDIFAAYWPHQNDAENPGAAVLNNAKKYVVSHAHMDPTWSNTTVVKDDVVEQIKKLKQENGPDLQVHGSGNLIQTLMKYDLVDEFWLKIFPVTLGTGKRLFASGTMPAAFTLKKSSVSPSGVIVADYVRAGSIKTGSF